jgi:oligoendopeptidase F
MTETISNEVRARRKYIPANYDITTWEALMPFYQELESRVLNGTEDLLAWLHDSDELDAMLQEEGSRRFIAMTCHTNDEAAVARYTAFLTELSPHITEHRQALVRKYYDSPHRAGLDASRFQVLNRIAANSIELFREENIPLQTQLEVKAQEFSAISGAMTVEVDGETLTLQQAAKYLEQPDRDKRELVWRKVAARRAQDREKLNVLFDDLKTLRTQVAQNAGYESYSAFRFAELGRFDYTCAECEAFHQAVEQYLTPLNTRLQKHRAKLLGLPALRPWDTEVNPFGDRQLHPFTDAEDLTKKSVEVFNRLKPELGEMVTQLRTLGQLDLDSRVGKAPGGYNCSLHETGVPFIFMNAAGLHKDLVTMVHECGHAFHSILTHSLPYGTDKEFPSEIAEVASMGMELVTMDHWEVFYPHDEDLQLARMEQLARVVNLFPWIATVDAFQFWLYDNPNHTETERADAFARIHARFHPSEVDWTDLEDYRRYLWQRQIHIFEIPFYYIEYGIAQLGALQLWRNYRKVPEKALADYLQALGLGYSKPLPEVFAAANIRFDFSPVLIAELSLFLETRVVEAGLVEA